MLARYAFALVGLFCMGSCTLSEGVRMLRGHPCDLCKGGWIPEGKPEGKGCTSQGCDKAGDETETYRGVNSASYYPVFKAIRKVGDERDSGVQDESDSGVQDESDSGVQDEGDSGVQDERDSGVQDERDSGVQDEIDSGVVNQTGEVSNADSGVGSSEVKPTGEVSNAGSPKETRSKKTKKSSSSTGYTTSLRSNSDTPGATADDGYTQGSAGPGSPKNRSPMRFFRKKQTKKNESGAKKSSKFNFGWISSGKKKKSSDDEWISSGKKKKSSGKKKKSSDDEWLLTDTRHGK